MANFISNAQKQTAQRKDRAHDLSQPSTDFTAKAFSAQPGYDEASLREDFAKLMPLRTVIITCFDPRAAGIAEEFGEVYPGEAITDSAGETVGTTATVLNVVVAGGRAMDALRSITVTQHLLGVVVVHHTHCGATSYTAVVEAEDRDLNLRAQTAAKALRFKDFRPRSSTLKTERARRHSFVPGGSKNCSRTNEETAISLKVIRTPQVRDLKS